MIFKIEYKSNALSGSGRAVNVEKRSRTACDVKRVLPIFSRGIKYFQKIRIFILIQG